MTREEWFKAGLNRTEIMPAELNPAGLDELVLKFTEYDFPLYDWLDVFAYKNNKFFTVVYPDDNESNDYPTLEQAMNDVVTGELQY